MPQREATTLAVSVLSWWGVAYITTHQHQFIPASVAIVLVFHIESAKCSQHMPAPTMKAES